jgi:D-tyrosyl-tRNA(Tyr) deacylase
MKAVVQRVTSAEVTVDGACIAAIEAGLLVYLGVGCDDDERQAAALAEKVRRLRIFPDDDGKMNRDVGEVGGAVLVVSNFSLYADARKGRRPSYVAAAPPEKAKPLYEHFCDVLSGLGVSVGRGRFQAMMAVRSVNDGPINILLDTSRVT